MVISKLAYLIGVPTRIFKNEHEARKSLDKAVYFNIQELFQEAIRHARAELSTGEQAQFYNRYLKPMRMNVDKDGNVGALLG